MAYEDLLNEEGITSQYLVVLKPRRFFDPDLWVFVSGTKYVQAFSLGQVVLCQKDDTLLQESSTSALLDGSWYYDEGTTNLFIDVGDDPSTFDVVGTYEVYVGTFDAHFNRTPLEATSRVVYYEPLITKSPEVLASNSDILFGFLPSNSTSIEISNLTQFLQEHLYSSSFNRAEVEVYHWLDELTTANLKLITRGLCGSITSSDESIQMTIFDNNDLFNAEFRHFGGESFYAGSNFPLLDPNFQSRPIRRVYGVVESFIPVNISYEALTPTSLTNRTFSCLKPYTNLGSLSTSVPASPSSTATRTYLTSALGFRLGDSVWIDSHLGSGSDEFPIITALGSNYIEHTALMHTSSSTDVVKRSFVGLVTIFKEGLSYKAKYGRDYQEYTDSINDIAGFSFQEGLEANLGISTLTTQDLVYARVYGNKNTTTLSGSSFGGDSSLTGSLTHPIVIFFDLLTNYLNLAESKIDLPSFTSLESSLSDEVGFAIPNLGTNNFPTFKDLFSNLALTLLLKIYIDDDNKFSITQTGPQGDSSKTIADDEVLDSTFSYDFDYRDILSDIFLEFSPREVSLRSQSGDVYYSQVKAESPVAKRLHKISRQETFQSLHFLEAQALTLADRLSYALGERRGMISFTTKNRFFDSEINEVIKINRSKLMGYPYLRETLRQRNGVVISTTKSLDKIVITLDDQKGIEDNQATWGT